MAGFGIGGSSNSSTTVNPGSLVSPTADPSFSALVQKILASMPLDGEAGTYGRINFEVYKK